MISLLMKSNWGMYLSFVVSSHIKSEVGDAPAEAPRLTRAHKLTLSVDRWTPEAQVIF